MATDSAGRVTEIDLGGPFGNGLTGSIPDEIGQLSELVRLDLSGNDLGGSLPGRIFDLAKLEELRLSDTGLCVPRSQWSSGSPFDSLPGAGVGICPSLVDAVGSGHGAALEALAERGIFEGTECAGDSICPDEAIKRWTMAVWLVRALDGRDPPSVQGTAFDDVDPEVWWLSHVNRLAELRVTRGCAAQPLRFCPDDPVTRAQMASFLVRAFGLDPAPSAGFRDTAGSVHGVAIDALAHAGITVGCKTEPLSYCPDQPVTRAQMATFIARALGLV